ncbi:hypothetical protein B0H34DRAFT_126364 [Crassisporium funariophilum]|nr:hypothetical protein B0H34DRAFT_126364 [Crassisporium funariophilum]
MHFKTLFVSSIVCAITLVNAQIIGPANWWSQLPPCAQQCALQAAQTAGCDINDLKCLCSSKTFYWDFLNCVMANCPSTTDVSAATALFSKYCYSVDWTWGMCPCVKNCALKAAQLVGCDINDRACLCANKAAFTAAFLDCVRNSCPDQLPNTQSYLEKLCRTFAVIAGVL